MRADGIRRTTLEGGVRVLTERMPELRSVALGFWVGVGSRDEPEELAGASHFLEHLLFKGTPTRGAAEIARAIEGVGGEMNAFTTREYTAFYVRVLDESLDLALEILSDVIWSPAFDADEVEAERQVILEEISMVEDAPDDLVHEVLAETLYPGHPLGRSTLGTRDTIERMAGSAIAGYHARHYQPSCIAVSAAGNLDHEAVVDGVRRHLTSRPAGEPTALGDEVPVPCSAATRVLGRATEQAHLALGIPALPWRDPDRYALDIVNQVLGGGMSSRLFQEVRERRGLAYSVYSHRAAYRDAGFVGVYAGTAPLRAHTVVEVVHEQLDLLVEGGISADELDHAKCNLKGGLALGLEESAARMSRLGRAELLSGEVLGIDEVVARVEAVDGDDVARVIDRVFRSGERVLAVVGPFDEGSFDRLVA